MISERVVKTKPPRRRAFWRRARWAAEMRWGMAEVGDGVGWEGCACSSCWRFWARRSPGARYLSHQDDMHADGLGCM